MHLARHLLLIFIHLVMIIQSTSQSNKENEKDRLSLLAFKEKITYIKGTASSLDNWNGSTHFCKWQGITCSNTTTNQRVIALNLQSQSLYGTLSPHLQNLTFLQELNLGYNHFQGNIPPQLGNLVNLRVLNLSSNNFGGKIPSNLSLCKQLIQLDLGINQLEGEIPNTLTTLSKLSSLQLQENNLTGIIPVSVGNLSSLTALILGRNNLQGSIPDSIGAITGLDFFQVAENQLSGKVPLSLYNLSSLTFITFASNHIQGSLPSTLGLTLPKLDTFYVGGNKLFGNIPVSLSNASGLINLDFAYNNFSGSIPKNLGNLRDLEWLNFEGNSLGHGVANDLDFVISLINCTKLQVFDIDSNSFGGMLPKYTANLSTQLSFLIMSNNQIRGSIPENIGNLASLSMLRLENNILVGNIPSNIGLLQNLQILSLSQNRLDGFLQPSVGNLTQLTDLLLSQNNFHGSIPLNLKYCISLKHLDLSGNKLSGTIPKEVIGISSLSTAVNLARNFLVGHLPAEIGGLKHLGELDVSKNRLSGEIPQELGDCESLEYLEMQENLFVGSIPSTLRNLKGILYIDLSSNNLSGTVPDFMQNLHSIWHLNLSYNDFHGLVPKEGVFMNVSAISLQGNEKLCGGISLLNLSTCSNEKYKKSNQMHVIIPIICVLSGLSSLSCLISAIYCWKKRKTVPPTISLFGHNKMVTYKDLYKATDGFSSLNLIGEGSFGKVYRGTTEKIEADVAIKVLNLQNPGALKSFMAECETLRQVKHRNLVKIFTICSSMDANRNEFKALVYEFMPNGNLDEWLHYSKSLNIYQRLSICIDICTALEYLHHQSQTPIVHCDLKPSNVLLDQDMNAHVSDFGLAKILFNDLNSLWKISSTGIKGSIGYIPPEYGLGGEVTTQGDVYSYGVLMLEMLTGKRPTNDTFSNGLGLHDFVRMSYPEHVMEIIDPRLIQDMKVENIAEQDNTMETKIRRCVIPLIDIGLSCSASSPNRRMNMKQVAAKLYSIQTSLLGE